MDHRTHAQRPAFLTRTGRRSRLLLGALAICAAPACAEDPSGAPPAEQPPATTPADADAHPPAMYSMQMPNGNKIDFYDIEGNALVIETGVAGGSNAPMLPGARQLANGNVADIFRALQPNAAVPPAIAALAEKVAQGQPASADEPAVEVDSKEAGRPDAPTTALEGGDDVRRSAVLEGCNNGCCDPDWTQNSLCAASYDPIISYGWYLFNYGWTTVNLNSKTYAFEGIACSAIGTSAYKVSLSGGGGGSWSVHEGNYLDYHWSGARSGTKKSAALSVNSSSNSHAHTFCGWKLQ